MNGTDPELQRLLSAAGQRLKFSAVLGGVCWSVAVCLGLWLALFAFDSLLNLPPALRFPLALGGAGFTLLSLTRRVLAPAFRRQTLERTALQLEDRYAIPDNLLINAVQFRCQPLRPEERPFADKTIVSSSAFMGRLRPSDLWGGGALAALGAAAAGVVLLWLLCLAVFPRQFVAAGARYLKPLGDTPPPGRLALRLTPAEDISVAEGEDLTVKVELEYLGGGTPVHAPTLTWQEGIEVVPPSPTGGNQAVMSALAGSRLSFAHAFPQIHAPFAFRVFAGESYTRSVQVKVRPVPRLREASFQVIPPEYTGARAQILPGPPSAVACLPGSTVGVSLAFDPPVKGAWWSDGGTSVPLKAKAGRWEGATIVTNAGVYEVRVPAQGAAQPLVVARGDVRLLADNAPEIDFVTDDRNRLVQYGETLKLELEARDDFGLQSIGLVARASDQDDSFTLLKKWTYLGPPGPTGPLRESWALAIDPRVFSGASTYYLEAWATDFRPGTQPARSRPILLRLKWESDLAVDADDPLATAFARLKETIARQQKANHLGANLRAYLDEAVQKRTVAQHRQSIAGEQSRARESGQQTLAALQGRPEGKGFATVLAPLVGTEMPAVLADLGRPAPSDRAGVASELAAIEERQARILAGLLSLLGQMADTHRGQPPTDSDAKPASPLAQASPEEQAKELLSDLQRFAADQERIVQKSRTLADKAPMDLTDKPEDVLGELAREEEQWAKFIEDKLNDLSKLPTQDFADASLARELNSVFQEIQMAANALAQKAVELAVPHEQSGLENARELMHNLERWLPDAPDNLKWSMEEPLAPTDVALAELPAELEDIVGDLLDKEESMTSEVEDVTSSWMDSADKGAGWDAMDGPISNMSAKGVTGNLLPNQQEIGGRAGEGRTGRSHGQFVSDSAEGKGGRQTPSRLTPSPFEQGSVKDADKQDRGGGTGGGKLSGFGAEGLRGPAPPRAGGALPRLADRQAKIRQEAEALALKLRRHRVPTGELESSVTAMKQVETAAQKSDGLAVRRAFNHAVSSLGQARTVIQADPTLKREQARLPGWMRSEIRSGVQDGVPKGYEEMAGEYFRALAEGRARP